MAGYFEVTLDLVLGTAGGPTANREVDEQGINKFVQDSPLGTYRVYYQSSTGYGVWSRICGVSMLVGLTLQMPFDPSNHYCYVVTYEVRE